VDAAVAVQAPAMFMPEFPLELLELLLLQATGSSNATEVSKSSNEAKKRFMGISSFAPESGWTKYSAED
jgi:hypothetical protein